MEGYDGAAVFGEQCQWSQLDDALASSSENGPLALPHLEFVRLSVVLCHSQVGNGRLARKFIRRVTNRVLGCRFPFINAMASDGRLKVVRESVARDVDDTELFDS